MKIFKKCGMCQQLKGIEDFSSPTHSKDGRQARCKSCTSKSEPRMAEGFSFRLTTEDDVKDIKSIAIPRFQIG